MKSNMVSVIVPTLNEEGIIGEALKGLSCRRGIETVVVDGGSTDGTVAIARSLGAVIVKCPPGRARQMNEGARRAVGEVLLFLHADTRLPGDFNTHISKALQDATTVGGAFRLGFDADRPFLRFIERTANFRSKRLGIVFGDQAIFARRPFFFSAGGFPDQPIMEDYEFVRALRRCGRVVILPETVITSARRWQSVGPLRNSLLNVLITWAYALGISPGRLKSWHEKGVRGREPGRAAARDGQ